MKKLSLLFILIMVLIGLNSCKKDEQANTNNPPDTEEEQSPSIPRITFSGPITTSGDQNIAIINSIIQNMNASNFPQYRFLDATKSGSTWTRLYVAGDFVVTLTAKEQTDSYAWRMIYNGTDDRTNISYNNTLIMEVFSTKDNKKGSGSIYSNGNEVRTINWETASNNNLNGFFIDRISENSYQRNRISNNADGTGEVQILPNDKLSYKAQWFANGTGQWWNYDSTGTVISNGTW